MLESAQPVFVFLPMTRTEPDVHGVVVDPVCGRTLSDGEVAGRLLHNGQSHYFCSLRCVEQFASDARVSAARDE